MIAPEYLEWRDLGHAGGCTRTGWEASTKAVDFPGGRREFAVRLVCPKPKGCGMFHEWSAIIPPGDDSEDSRTGMSIESGPVEYIGYGTAPIKAGSVWLHAGPPRQRGRLGEDNSPEYFVVSVTAARPRTMADALGVVGPAISRGRQVKGRWFAGGIVDHERYGPSASPIRDDLASRTAAVRWVLVNAQTRQDT
ncbi:hypothetical protein [Nonomuraea sp. NPDC050310]|uniref:hypothetical protein n=1 Tax=Nonomuraea sp. NPDC050310 TaxID=3154935 RepID=UPI0033CA17B6